MTKAASQARDCGTHARRIQFDIRTSHAVQYTTILIAPTQMVLGFEKCGRGVVFFHHSGLEPVRSDNG